MYRFLHGGGQVARLVLAEAGDVAKLPGEAVAEVDHRERTEEVDSSQGPAQLDHQHPADHDRGGVQDRKSTRLNSSHVAISYAVFCLQKKTETQDLETTVVNETD